MSEPAAILVADLCALVGRLTGREARAGSRASELALESMDVVEIVLWLESRGIRPSASVLSRDFMLADLLEERD